MTQSCIENRWIKRLAVFSLSKLLDRLTTKLYIEVCERYIKVINLKRGFTFVCKPLIAVDANAKDNAYILAIGDKASTYPHAINPFAHPRVIVDNYKMAEVLMRYAFEQATRNRALFAPIAIIKSLREMDTPLSDIEKVALCELCSRAGAREVMVLDETDMDVTAMDYETLRQHTFICDDHL